MGLRELDPTLQCSHWFFKIRFSRFVLLRMAGRSFTLPPLKLTRRPAYGTPKRENLHQGVKLGSRYDENLSFHSFHFVS